MYNNFSELEGKILTSVERRNDELLFNCNDGTSYRMYHYQDCCESVTIDDICGDLEDLVETPILLAEENTSNENPDFVDISELYQESFTWTFYKIRTIKGSVDIRWYGSSNGYYSESVTFEKI